MNGIIHNCSHGNNEDPNFRVTEEQIFTDVSGYIDYLFRIIKPRKGMCTLVLPVRRVTLCHDRPEAASIWVSVSCLLVATHGWCLR